MMLILKVGFRWFCCIVLAFLLHFMIYILIADKKKSGFRMGFSPQISWWFKFHFFIHICFLKTCILPSCCWYSIDSHICEKIEQYFHSSICMGFFCVVCFFRSLFLLYFPFSARCCFYGFNDLDWMVWFLSFNYSFNFKMKGRIW